MKDIYKIGIGLILLLISSILFLKYAVSYLLPFVIAIILASLIEPAVELLEEKANFSRGIAVVVVLLVMIIVIVLVLTIIFSRLFIELDNLVNNLPDYQSIGAKFNWFSWLAERNKELSEVIQEWQMPDTIKETVSTNLQGIYNNVKTVIQLMISSLLDVAKKLPKLVTIIFISLISTFFISKDKDIILKTVLSPFSEEWRQKIQHTQMEIISAAVGFIRAQMILISITTVLSIIGLFVLGSKYAIVAGLSAGMLDLIPIIGPSLIFIPWAIYAIVYGRVKLAVGLLILYGLIALVRQLTEAKIVGQNIGIHPLATLVAIYLGVQIFGMSGFFIGPALLIVLKAIFSAGFISMIIESKE